MSMSCGSMRSFLVGARNKLHNAIINQQRVTLVIGNESADLDSITSAIVLAYFRSNASHSATKEYANDKQITPSQHASVYIPIVNVPRSDIKIRPELLALLPHGNLEPEHLITVDDLHANSLSDSKTIKKGELQPSLTQILLVDHNKLAGPLAQKGFSDQVVGSIDHHVDENVVPLNTGNEPRIIEKCGSCTSLVTRYCRSAWNSLSDAASSASRATSGQSDTEVGVDDDAIRKTWDAQIARLAIASVLVDTHCLRDESKTLDVDREVVNFLEAKILLAPGVGAAKWDRERFFDEIDTAKKDLNSLTPDEVCRKDYKQWEVNGKQFGQSSVVQPLSWLVNRSSDVEKFKEAIEEFVTQRKLAIYAISTTSVSDQGSFRRELLVWSVDIKCNPILDQFEQEYARELGLKPWDEIEDLASDDHTRGKLKIWWQTETQFSRKQTAPMIRKVMEKS